MTRSGRMNMTYIVGAAVLITGILTGMSCSEATATPAAKNTKTGTVTGVIGIEGVGPVMGGMVFFFNAAFDPPPMQAKYWRVPDASSRLDQNAQFSVVLPVGKYYLAAIERLSGEESNGPPREGDYFVLFKDRIGKPRQIAVRSRRVHNLGYLSINESFKQNAAPGDVAAIEGVVRNERSEPVEGISVLASTNRSMTGKPLFVSEPSSNNGTYRLWLPGGGKYFLRASTSPAPGKKQGGGSYVGTEITLVTGETRTGIDLVVSRPASTN